jgi:predicted RNase H-like HicB family nuclease
VEKRDNMELHVKVHHEDDAFWAEVEELPGCFASGRTTAELVEAVEEAVSMYLANSSPQPPKSQMATPPARQAVCVSSLTVATQAFQLA